MARARQGQHRYTGWGAPPPAPKPIPWFRYVSLLMGVAVLGFGFAAWVRPELLPAPIRGFLGQASEISLPGHRPSGPTVYRWEDSKGVVHYSEQKPPEGVAYRMVTLPPGQNVLPAGTAPWPDR